MANPNLKNLNNVYGTTEGVTDLPTSPTNLLANADSSGSVYKINTIYVTNTHASSDVDVTLDIYDTITSTIMGYFAKNTNVPNAQSVVPVSQNSPVYLNEGKTLRGTASIPSGISVIISYENIS